MCWNVQKCQKMSEANQDNHGILAAVDWSPFCHRFALSGYFKRAKKVQALKVWIPGFVLQEGFHYDPGKSMASHRQKSVKIIKHYQAVPTCSNNTLKHLETPLTRLPPAAFAERSIVTKLFWWSLTVTRLNRLISFTNRFLNLYHLYDSLP